MNDHPRNMFEQITRVFRRRGQQATEYARAQSGDLLQQEASQPWPRGVDQANEDSPRFSIDHFLKHVHTIQPDTPSPDGYLKPRRNVRFADDVETQHHETVDERGSHWIDKKTSGKRHTGEQLDISTEKINDYGQHVDKPAPPYFPRPLDMQLDTLRAHGARTEEIHQEVLRGLSPNDHGPFTSPSHEDYRQHRNTIQPSSPGPLPTDHPEMQPTATLEHEWRSGIYGSSTTRARWLANNQNLSGHAQKEHQSLFSEDHRPFTSSSTETPPPNGYLQPRRNVRFDDDVKTWEHDTVLEAEHELPWRARTRAFAQARKNGQRTTLEMVEDEMAQKPSEMVQRKYLGKLVATRTEKINDYDQQLNNTGIKTQTPPPNDRPKLRRPEPRASAATPTYPSAARFGTGPVQVGSYAVTPRGNGRLKLNSAGVDQSLANLEKSARKTQSLSNELRNMKKELSQVTEGKTKDAMSEALNALIMTIDGVSNNTKNVITATQKSTTRIGRLDSRAKFG